MINIKKSVHTKLEKSTYDWLDEQAKKDNVNINDIIEKIVLFYQENVDIPNKHKNLDLTLRKLIQKEIKELLSKGEL